MAARILTGTYTAGYTLSAGYSALTVAATGRVAGAEGTAGAAGQAGVTAGAPVTNLGAIMGGAGGFGGNGDVTGGAGGAAIVFESTASSGAVDNGGEIYGGSGGNGAGGQQYGAGGHGGGGGSGVILSVAGQVMNTGLIQAGSGGDGGDGLGGRAGAGGGGGIGANLAASADLANGGRIFGGAGGVGGGYDDASGVGPGSGGAGGLGIGLSGGTATNSGLIAGGAGGEGGYGYAYHGGQGGTGGIAVDLSGFGSLINLGTILGGTGGAGGHGEKGDGAAGAGGAGVVLPGSGSVVNGARGSNSAVISGGLALYAGFIGAATVTNFGTLAGSLGVCVQFENPADRLIAEAGSTFIGAARGGGGTLQLAGGSGTISGLGASGTLSGDPALSFSGFGRYIVNAGASFTLSGTDTLGANQQVVNYGTLLGALTFGSATDHLVLGDGSVSGTIYGDGGAIRLAGGEGRLTIGGATGGATGGIKAAMVNFGTYVIGAGGLWNAPDVTLTSRQTFISEGTVNLGETIGDAGQISAALGGKVNIVGATVTGGGLIEAGAASTVSMGAATIVGGGLISAGSGRVVFDPNSTVTLNGATSPLTLSGRFNLAAGGSLILAGPISLAGELTAYQAGQIVIENRGVTLSGGGKVYLSNSAANVIIGQSASATLTNVSEHIFGAGDIGKGQVRLINGTAGMIASFGSAGLHIDTGANTIENAGTIQANHATLVVASALTNRGVLQAAGTTLTLEGAVDGAGSAVILADGTLVADSAFGENVAFIGLGDRLTLAQSQAYGGTISDFSRAGASSLDLRDIGFVSAGEATFSGGPSGGVLTVSDGTHTARIKLAGDYTTSNFTTASDGQGGVIVTAARAGAFVGAMAGMGSGGMASVLPPSSAASAPAPAALARPLG